VTEQYKQLDSDSKYKILKDIKNKCLVEKRKLNTNKNTKILFIKENNMSCFDYLIKPSSEVYFDESVFVVHNCSLDIGFRYNEMSLDAKQKLLKDTQCWCNNEEKRLFLEKPIKLNKKIEYVSKVGS
jgi:hypothetical protein